MKNRTLLSTNQIMMIVCRRALLYKFIHSFLLSRPSPRNFCTEYDKIANNQLRRKKIPNQIMKS